MPDLRPRTSDPQGHSRDASYVVNCYRPVRFASFTDRQSLPKENGAEGFRVACVTQMPVVTRNKIRLLSSEELGEVRLLAHKELAGLPRLPHRRS